MTMLAHFALGVWFAGGQAPATSPPIAPPVIKVTQDDTVITQSCVLLIEPGTTIADTNGDGVIHIAADDVTIEWATGSVLRGASADAPPDTLTGVGISLRNHTGVTITGGIISGFKIGIDAEHASGLAINSTIFTDNFRQRLKSTPEAEDSTDWLYPHHDDAKEWASRWGAAVSVRHATNITLRNLRVRNGQNGILIHDVNDSAIFSNDVSFLSGWGIAMFRSNRNTISRNAADYCIRGHSEGVYNRGQDSAGLLAFEQCSNNTFIENSATHSGDGFFGFGGLEALGDQAPPSGFDHTRKGCNDNLFIGNDFSFASAHGLEMTFSFGNIIFDNRFEGDGICGIWGGYSQNTQIRHNTFINCGELAYGLERGGINIEHGANNTIADNAFTDNACGVHLWWDHHGDFESKPWGKANYVGTTGNTVADNTFAFGPNGVGQAAEVPMLQIRDERAATIRTPLTQFFGNTFDLTDSRGHSVKTDPGVALGTTGTLAPFPKPTETPLGDTSPIGRRTFGGRDTIIMGEWGPWDLESPLVRQASTSNAAHRWQIFGPGSLWKAIDLDTAEETRWAVSPTIDKPLEVVIANPAGLRAYRYRISNGDGWQTDISGTILGAWWKVRAFNWTEATDPRTHLIEWRALAQSPDAFQAQSGSLSLRFAHAGPNTLRWAHIDQAASIGPNHFGLVAHGSPTLPPGRYTLRTTSDDGIRITIDGKVVLENWTWHGPTEDAAEFEVTGPGPTSIQVEYFEIDGFAMLELAIEPVH